MYCQECKTEEGTPHKPGCSQAPLPSIHKDIPNHLNGLGRDQTPFTQAEVVQGVEAMEKILESKELPPENGDAYDEDTGDYLGKLTNDVATMCSLPAQISLFYEGYWYIFKPQSRYKEEKS